MTGMFFIANGLGSMLGSLIFELISLADHNKFVYTEGDNRKFIGALKGELKYYFFALAAFNFINLLLFARYNSRQRQQRDNDTEQTVHDYIRSAAMREARS